MTIFTDEIKHLTKTKVNQNYHLASGHQICNSFHISSPMYFNTLRAYSPCKTSLKLIIIFCKTNKNNIQCTLSYEVI